MQTFRYCLLLLLSCTTPAALLGQTSPQSLNGYVAFINQSVDVVAARFQMLQSYQDDVKRYQNKSASGLRLPSSGPLETYYFQKALAGNNVTPAEKGQLTAAAEGLWQRLNQIDRAAKALETYVRLNDYQRDNLSQSKVIIAEMQSLFAQFSRDKEAFYGQIQAIYRRYQPYQAANPYLQAEKQMEQVLQSQQQLLQKLTYYLDDESPANWPTDLVQQSMLADEALLTNFGKTLASLAYPASDMVTRFKAALQSLQTIKRQAVNEYTVVARQSARHGNELYRQLINHYNSDLLASHQAFVNYSRSARQLLDYPKYSPLFVVEAPVSVVQPFTRTTPFADKPAIDFTTKPASAPLGRPVFDALNAYVECINESLRQMHKLQLIVRNYQSSAASVRDPSRKGQRANLTYSHEAYKVPLADYRLLVRASEQIPTAYRPALVGQAEVLLAMLTEMDALSIELIAYTEKQQYVQDQWQRSDEILNRYAEIFYLFDQKKERLYADVRRVFDQYPVANPGSAWNKAGKALLKTLDDNKAVLFGVKSFLRLETAQLPSTDLVETDARTLITDEYQNLTGLTRLGRNNGLCPYLPYEDIAENSLRLADMARKVRAILPKSGPHPYQSFYYFFNNRLVYEYNKFSELAKEPLLKMVMQPDVFAFQGFFMPTSSPGAKQADPSPTAPVSKPQQQPAFPTPIEAVRPNQMPTVNDTVYVERTRVDTVYIDRTQPQAVQSLNGFAANNMVLLLDVSGSMDSPFKMPLLKRSIKSLLTLIRSEDQISVVVYSGKARVVLKPTSGTEAREIARIIDNLQSEGDTDGNEGLKLAYKVANRNYLRAGNNRIVLATDGEFPVSDEVMQLIAENAKQDVYLTIFTFGRNPLTGQNLKKLSQIGQGSYTHITAANAQSQLILEAQAKKLPAK